MIAKLRGLRRRADLRRGATLPGHGNARGFAFAHFRAVGKAKAAESWPSAVGRVTSAEVLVEESEDSDGNSSTWYNPVVAYIYSAGRGELEGRRLRFGNPRSGSRAKADRVIPLAKSHGAALIALTIDEVGMAKTADRKVEIAQRIAEIACDEHGLEREALIFDVLTFTLTTGDDEWKPSAVETSGS